MNKKRGYIILWRSLQDSEIWDDEEPFDMRAAWVDLIMMAAHKDKTFIVNHVPTTIKRGQIYTSVRKLAARWHWGVNRTLRYLRTLEQLNMIRRDATPYRTLLTLVNYGFLQDPWNSDGDSDRDSDGDTHRDSDGSHTKNVRNNVRKNVRKKKEGGDSRTYEE